MKTLIAAVRAWAKSLRRKCVQWLEGADHPGPNQDLDEYERERTDR